MWSDKLKLNKQLVRSVTEAGFLTPKEVQVKTLSRIIGGQDLVVIGPEGSGKTTAYILGVLTRLKYGFEEAPRALILVPDKEKVSVVIEQIGLLNKNPTIRVVGLFAPAGIEAQMDALADGADIVVATPDRARAVYLKLGLNLNKIQMFIVDDADALIKQGLQLPVTELANSITKCQHLVFTQVAHQKLNTMIAPFMHMPATIEVEEMGEANAEIYEQVLYNTPNYRTKLNLLNLLLHQVTLAKTVVFVGTRLNAEKIYSHLRLGMKNEVAILNPMMFDSKGFSSVEEFKDQDEIRVLIVANEVAGTIELDDIPVLIHFELPDDTETFTGRMIRKNNEDVLSVILVTDLELILVKKIEHATGQKITVSELPTELVIITEQKDNKAVKKEAKNKLPAKGEAFHEKKASNSKDYNISASKKAKMNKKKNQ